MNNTNSFLISVDIGMACTVFPKIFDVLTQLWLSEKAEVVNCATHAMDVLFKDALATACGSHDTVKQNKSKLEKCFNTIQLGLGYQYNTVWHQVFHIVKVMFEVNRCDKN